MSATTWSKFFWNDWFSDPGVRASSYAARGLWIDMLCLAATSDQTGFLSINGRDLDSTDVARLTGGTVQEVDAMIAELESNGVFSRDRHKRIYSRRLVRDAKAREIAVQTGKKGGNPALRKCKGISDEDKGDPNPPLEEGLRVEPTPISQKPERKKKNKSKKERFFSAAIVAAFERWWPIYPLHVARAAALAAFAKALEKTSLESLIDGAKRYAQQQSSGDRKFIAHPATWLNQERWADEVDSTKPADWRTCFD